MKPAHATNDINCLTPSADTAMLYYMQKLKAELGLKLLFQAVECGLFSLRVIFFCDI